MANEIKSIKIGNTEYPIYPDVAKSANKLKSVGIDPFNGSGDNYYRIATLRATSQYGGGLISFLVRTCNGTSSYGSEYKVYARLYQQNSMGQNPAYIFRSDCDGIDIDIVGVLNVTSSESRLDIYAYCKGKSWNAINISIITGDEYLNIGDSENNLPSGTVVNPYPMGNVNRLNGFSDSDFWKKTELTNLNQLTNGPGYITSSGSITVSSGVPHFY